jgi:heme/copper-type cytochrome/quinol oxidase subunit 2
MSRAAMRSVLALGCTALAASAASACPSCYGAADSPMTAGMNVAILTMVGIISVVLSSVVAFTLMMRKRLARLSGGAAPDSTEHN